MIPLCINALFSQNNNTQIFSAELPSNLTAAQLARLNEIKAVRTAPRDERFPSTNQALHCWNLYNEWLLCTQQKGEEKCQVARQHADSMCPSIWSEAWDEQREEGTFSGIGSRFEKAAHH